MKAPVLANRFERPILFVSLFSFCLYWFYLREENDLDQGLKVSLFERVPGAEEPHLRQLIPRMRTAGQDTREAEARLRELVRAREAREHFVEYEAFIEIKTQCFPVFFRCGKAPL